MRNVPHWYSPQCPHREPELHAFVRPQGRHVRSHHSDLAGRGSGTSAVLHRSRDGEAA